MDKGIRDAGKELYMDLCGRLINRILEFNPDEHDIELNLCGIIAKAKKSAEIRKLVMGCVPNKLKEDIEARDFKFMNVVTPDMIEEQIKLAKKYNQVIADITKNLEGVWE